MNIGLSTAMKFGEPTPQAALGIMYLGAVLRDNGFKSTLYDTQYMSGIEEFRTEMELLEPDVMGFTVRTTEYNNAVEIARLVKQANPACIVIFGGPHATVCPEQCLQNPEVDIVVYGEGEVTILELIQALDTGRGLDGIRGVIYKQGDEVIKSAPRPPIENLDAIPFPARDLLKGFRDNFQRVSPFPWVQPVTNIICTRGVLSIARSASRC